MVEEYDEDGNCFNCSAHEPPIFLCEAGWVCEPCFRQLSGLSPEVESADLHDGINEGRWSDEIERVKMAAFGELDEP